MWAPPLASISMSGHITPHHLWYGPREKGASKESKAATPAGLQVAPWSGDLAARIWKVPLSQPSNPELYQAATTSPPRPPLGLDPCTTIGFAQPAELLSKSVGEVQEAVTA